MSAHDLALIVNLLGRYCHVVDAEPVERLAELFWPDATLVAPDGGQHDGIDAIIAWGREWDATMRAPVAELRHRVTSPHITVVGDTAESLAYFDADTITATHLISVRGRYVDRLERRDDDWRFSYRRIETWTPPARTPLASGAS